MNKQFEVSVTDLMVKMYFEAYKLGVERCMLEAKDGNEDMDEDLIEEIWIESDGERLSDLFKTAVKDLIK